MKIIKSEKNFRVFEGNAEMLNNLPKDFYNVQFHPMVGFYLETTAAPEIKEKIYGTAQKKVEKTAKTFGKVGRNLGVLLSGAKGMGKTSFAKLLALTMCKKMPVIFINQYLENIASFINSIEQEVVIVFDEFEKTFKKNGIQNGPNNKGGSQQDELLTLFDGVFGGSKKLFIVTCNELSGISDFMLSRPGRFHYHYKFTKPEENEINEYLKDNLEENVYKEFGQQVKSFAVKAEINFDCLRAICFELNNENDLKETLEDLNIYNNLDERKKYKIKIQTNENVIEQECYINLFQPGEININSNESSDENINWRFMIPISEIKEDSALLLKGGYAVDPAKIKVDGWDYDENKPAKFEGIINSITLERVLERTNFSV